MLSSGSLLAEIQQFHSHSNIIETVNNYVMKNLQKSKDIEFSIQISPIDTRLKLTACELPLNAFSASNLNLSTKFSVGVKCNGIKPWSLYASVRVKKYSKLYSTAVPISRGEPITEKDIILVRRDISNLRQGFFNNKARLIGMLAKRNLRVGTIISAKHLVPPVLVKKGDNVDIVVLSNTISIRMSGEAMSNGAKGQKIRVKNNSSKKIVNAIVTTANTVKIEL